MWKANLGITNENHSQRKLFIYDFSNVLKMRLINNVES